MALSSEAVNLRYVLFRELVLTLEFAARLPKFVAHIAAVGRGRAEKEMVWPYAWWVVAVMANECSGRYRSVVD